MTQYTEKTKMCKQIYRYKQKENQKHLHGVVHLQKVLIRPAELKEKSEDHQVLNLLWWPQMQETDSRGKSNFLL
jgi:hypothetical protein